MRSRPRQLTNRHRHRDRQRWAAAALISSLVFLSPSASADSGIDQTSWGLGLGVASTQKPYTDIDRETNLLPLLHFENKYIRFFGTELEAKLPGIRLNASQQLKFGLIARYDNSGYEADDSPVLDGMEERKGGFWGGAKVQWETSLVNFRADWTHDLSGKSKGQRVNLGIDRAWQMGERFTLAPRVTATWYDSKYIDYYYGVRADEVRAGRPAYQGGSGFSTSIGLRGIYQLNKHHSLMLDVQATRLSSGIKDSPVVDRSTQNRVSLGYMYHF